MHKFKYITGWCFFSYSGPAGALHGLLCILMYMLFQKSDSAAQMSLPHVLNVERCEISIENMVPAIEAAQEFVVTL